MDVRKFILITLSQADQPQRAFYNPNLISGKVRELFNCQAVVVAKELHSDGNSHYHCGVLNDSASRRTATKLIRNTFFEFDGKGCHVSFHKSWNTICTYIAKQDQNPYCWGISLNDFNLRATSKRKVKKEIGLEGLRQCATWADVLRHPYFGPKALCSHNSVKSTYEDLKATQLIPPVTQRLQEVIEQKDPQGLIAPYTDAELGDKIFILDWLAINLALPRTIRQSQLMIVGPPGVGKTEIIAKLRECSLRVYGLPVRKDDFTGATAPADIWVRDEFDDKSYTPSVINSVLDGQHARLDIKYGNVFLKDINVPIILISNHTPQELGMSEAFITRVTVTFFTQLTILDVSRLAMTLLQKMKHYSPQNALPSNNSHQSTTV